MKSHVTLLANLLDDLGRWCGASTHRDLETITMRVEGEGDGFLSITLPAFGKDLERALDRGFVASDLFTGFRFRGGLPAFLSGFLRTIFDEKTGVLLIDPSASSIRAVRQICGLYGKVFSVANAKRVSSAMEAYVAIDEEVGAAEYVIPEDLLAEVRLVCRILYADLFAEVGNRLRDATLIPRFGPGATADRKSSNQRFVIEEWPERLHRALPWWHYALPTPTAPDVSLIPLDREIPVRVIAVPKTAKTPRIIAVEPSYMQFAQQAILHAIVEGVESREYLRSQLSWSSQEPNRQAARLGSISGEFATLDLSEASDRVSCRLVRAMALSDSDFLEALFASRSRQADVPGHGVLSLAKFASMGSATTFAVETLLFGALATIGVLHRGNIPLRASDVLEAFRKVRAYGDDLIVPSVTAQAVVDVLHSCGLKVNATKSFWTGRFRESCGAEWYDGHDVSYVKVRHALTFDGGSTDEGVVKTMELRNRLYASGYFRAAAFLDTEFIRAGRRFSEVPVGHPSLGRWSYTPELRVRTNPDTFVVEVLTHVVSSRIPSDVLDGYGALLKCFLHQGREPLDAEHLSRAGRPATVHIKRRWTPLVIRGTGAQ